MDLRNLISPSDDHSPPSSSGGHAARHSRPNILSGTNGKDKAGKQDNLNVSNNQQSPVPHIRGMNTTQPRLSIHDLMNGDESTSIPLATQTQKADKNEAIQQDAAPAPIGSITPRTSVPSTEPTSTEKSSVDKTNTARRHSDIASILNDGNNQEKPTDKKPKEVKQEMKVKRKRGRPKGSTKKTSNGETKKASKKRPVKKPVKTEEELEKEEKIRLEKEIQQLKKVNSEESKSQKPRRYEKKPTWAKDYIPKLLLADENKKESFANPTKLKVPSITGSIPRNDFNKLVTDWIWANVQGIKNDFPNVPNVENYMELELKVGRIWDKVKDRRIQLPTNTECVVNMDYIHQNCFFRPGMSAKNYGDIKGFLEKLVKDGQTGRRNDKFIVETSHNVDLLASEKRQNEKLATARVTIDVKTKRRVASIDKERVSDLFIYLPSTLFDLRLSLSLELPHELNDAAFENFKQKVTLTRDKDRVSYVHQATATRLDLTKIKENGTSKYELELEIITPELLRSMGMIRDDPLYYVDLVQAFLDNGRIVTRQLSVQY